MAFKAASRFSSSLSTETLRILTNRSYRCKGASKRLILRGLLWDLAANRLGPPEDMGVGRSGRAVG